MQIILNKLGKQYVDDWIFKNLSLEIKSGEGLAILGANGSGKSTLIQMIASFCYSTSGKIVYSKNNLIIDPDDLYQYITFMAPYQELIEEFSLKEFFTFNAQFKSILNNLSVDDLVELSNLKQSKEKRIKFFSSGMKQRVKLIQCLCFDSDLILMDEPTSNLDKIGVEWYRGLMKNFKKERTVLISSNHIEAEYEGFVDHTLLISDYK